MGFNPDSFGHNMMIPQILKKMGIDYYIFMRPRSHEKELPASLFWWQSSDGSRVLAYRLFSYGAPPGNLKGHIQESSEAFNPEELKSSSGEIMCFYGVGDHGGGPTKENIECIKTFGQEFLNDTLRTVFSSPNVLVNVPG